MESEHEYIREISKYSDQIGGFAAKYGNLVASCDGVGTKILLAQVANKKHGRSLKSIGIDCVAMVVNDLLCKGAEPMFFLDYYASDKLVEREFYEVLSGIQDGCIEAGMELVGGETAVLNGVIAKETFDVCGFGIGKIIDELPKDNIRMGDSVIGLKSTGIHSNGFTLIRKYIASTCPAHEVSILLEPTKIYVNDIETMRKVGVRIKALAHITGGGFKNVNRILPDGMEVNYFETYDYYAHDELFRWVQLQTNLKMEEMRDIFNCGIGMVMIIPSEDTAKLPRDCVYLGKMDGKSKDR